MGSLANALLGAGCLISSPLIKRFGPWVVTLVGAVMFSVGLAATSFAPHLIYAFFTFGILGGVGGNFIFQSGVQLLYDWFPAKHSSRAFALGAMGTSFGKQPRYSLKDAAFWHHTTLNCTFVLPLTLK